MSKNRRNVTKVLLLITSWNKYTSIIVLYYGGPAKPLLVIIAPQSISNVIEFRVQGLDYR